MQHTIFGSSSRGHRFRSVGSMLGHLKTFIHPPQTPPQTQHTRLAAALLRPKIPSYHYDEDMIGYVPLANLSLHDHDSTKVGDPLLRVTASPTSQTIPHDACFKYSEL